MNAAPEGWRPIPRLSPFNALVGPLYQRSAGESLSIGMRIEEKHGAGGVRIVRASAIFARSEKE